MKVILWRGIARTLARPAVFRFLRWLTFNRNMGHLPGYMDRWWLVPYSWKLPFAARLHHIQRPDLDDCLHDHPWDWRTVVLKGWYIEENVFGEGYVAGLGSTRYRTAEDFHRITDVSEGGVWTLFITYKWRNRWGFMTGVPPRKVYYRDYNPPVPRHGEIPEAFMSTTPLDLQPGPVTWVAPEFVPAAQFREHLEAWRENSRHQGERIDALEKRVAALEDEVNALHEDMST